MCFLFFFFSFFVDDIKRVNHKEARSVCLPFRPPGTQSGTVYSVLCVREQTQRPPDHSLRMCIVKGTTPPPPFPLICQLPPRSPRLIESGLARPPSPSTLAREHRKWSAVAKKTRCGETRTGGVKWMGQEACGLGWLEMKGVRACACVWGGCA